LGVSEAQQRFFLMWARPPIILATFALFVTLEATAEDGPGRVGVTAAGLALVTSPLFALAARRFRPTAVLRAALVFDTVVIAAMAASLGRPDLFVLGFVWSMIVAAFLFGPRETLAFSALSMVTAVVAASVSAIDIDGVTLATDILVLAVAGGLLSLLSHRARTAEAALARERAYDAAALRMAERIRSSLDLESVLHLTVEELGEAIGAARSALRLPPDETGKTRLIQWTRSGTERLDLPVPPPPVQRVLGEGHPLVVDDAADADDEVRRFLQTIGGASVILYPVTWHGRVVAALGISDDRPRNWTLDALPLLQRISPQIAAALAQAELFEQQQTALARLEELSRLREDLVATVSHELRTPLTSAIGFLRTLERTDVSFRDEDRRRFLAVARGEAERLAVLVEDLLELTRLDRGVVRLTQEAVRVADVVARATRGFEARTGRQIAVEVDERLTAYADGDRLLQIVSNLVANGLEHGDGTVRVRGEDDADGVALRVSDDGPGIPENRASDLFVPFARASDDTRGTGLGLAIARGLAEAHGGSLSYRPRRNGEPHAFVLKLPRPPAETLAGSHSTHSTPAG
jgi:K+-sensing histidine kinase KdpD